MARLEEAGVDPLHVKDPAEAWIRLFERFGLRATLIDRLLVPKPRRIHSGHPGRDLGLGGR